MCGELPGPVWPILTSLVARSPAGDARLAGDGQDLRFGSRTAKPVQFVCVVANALLGPLAAKLVAGNKPVHKANGQTIRL